MDTPIGPRLPWISTPPILIQRQVSLVYHESVLLDDRLSGHPERHPIRSGVGHYAPLFGQSLYRSCVSSNHMVVSLRSWIMDTSQIAPQARQVARVRRGCAWRTGQCRATRTRFPQASVHQSRRSTYGTK